MRGNECLNPAIRVRFHRDAESSARSAAPFEEFASARSRFFDL
jgi:hypothetical protein